MAAGRILRADRQTNKLHQLGPLMQKVPWVGSVDEPTPIHVEVIRSTSGSQLPYVQSAVVVVRGADASLLHNTPITLSRNAG